VLTGEHVAVKIVDKTRIKSYKTLLKLDTEVEIQSSCEHPNIVTLRAVYDDSECRCFVMDHMSGGDLFDRIVESVVLSEREASATARSLLGAVSYLHSRGIVHRDLKPENILYSQPGKQGVLKLCDFGFAKRIEEGKPLTTPCGTLNYAAPEILAESYDRAVDMWAVGCITYFMLFGTPPFYSEADDDDEVLHQILRTEKKGRIRFPSDAPVSKPALDFISTLLHSDPRQRMTADEALLHSWVSGRGVPQEVSPQLKKYYAARVSESTGDDSERAGLRTAINRAIELDAPEDEAAAVQLAPVESSLLMRRRRKRSQKKKANKGKAGASQKDAPSAVPA